MSDSTRRNASGERCGRSCWDCGWTDCQNQGDFNQCEASLNIRATVGASGSCCYTLRVGVLNPSPAKGWVWTVHGEWHNWLAILGEGRTPQWLLDNLIPSSRSHSRSKFEVMRLVEGVSFSNILKPPLRCIDSNMGDWNRWGTISYKIGRKKIIGLNIQSYWLYGDLCIFLTLDLISQIKPCIIIFCPNLQFYFDFSFLNVLYSINKLMDVFCILLIIFLFVF